MGANITGSYFVGGVVGRIVYGSVNRCYVTGSVSGTESVGGVIGMRAGGDGSGVGTIHDCYSAATVSGTDRVGGVGGTLFGTVENCYSTGTVSGNKRVGGVAGYVSSGDTVKNCAALNPSVSGTDDVGRVVGRNQSGTLFGNIAFSGMTVTVDESAKTLDEGANKVDGATTTAAEIIAGNFFETLFGDDSAWTYETGKLPILAGLSGQDATMPAHIIDIPAGQFFNGEGTAADEYQISTPQQLAKLAELVNAKNSTYNASTVYYKLTSNIDLSAYGETYNEGKGWMPIGNNYNSGAKFKGHFDGNGHIISGLYIDSTDYDAFGLFGNAEGGSIKNLGLQNVAITGGAYTGGVVGYIRGLVENCYVTGVVQGDNNVGGVVGEINNAETIKNCYATASVSGNIYVGGIVGRCNGTMENCAALNPSVSGTSNVGRVAGNLTSATISGNIAFSGMTVMVNGSPKSGVGNTGNHMDGLGKTSAELQTIVGFPSGFNASPWTYTPGKLPGLGGTAVDMPAYLQVEGASPFEGAGTSESDPYLIKTAADLARLAELMNDTETNYTYGVADVYYMLMNDLDLSDIDPKEDGSGWVPIGDFAWDSEDSTAVAANTAYGWTFMPDDDANYYSRAGSFTPYSRSSGGSGGSGGGTTSPATPTPPTSPNVGADGAVSQSTITGEAATALGAATGTTATVRTQGASQINPTTLDALAGAGAQAGRQVVLHADTMTGSAVQGRLYVEPAKLTGRTEPLKLGVYTEPARTATTTGLFERFFDNNIATISLEQQGSFGASLQIAARVDLSTLDITALVFYSYDKATNTYRRIEKPAYWVDTNGYLHFTTELAGDIIISNGPLALK